MSQNNWGSRRYQNNNRDQYRHRGGGRGNSSYGRGDNHRYHHPRSDEDRYGRNGGHGRNDGEGHYRDRREYEIDRRPCPRNDEYENGRAHGGRDWVRDGSGSRDEEPNNSKRPASSPAALEISEGDSGGHQKRTKLDQSSPAASLSKGALTTESIDAASSAESSNKNDAFIIPETEDAYKQAYSDCLRDCDKPTYPVSRQAHQMRMGWTKSKAAAVEATIKQLSNIPRSDNDDGDNGYDDGYSSSDDSYPPGPGASYGKNKLQKGLTPGEIKFIRALQCCPPLDAGFQVVRSLSSKICYCPCGPNVEPWRKKHGILLGGECAKSNFTPNYLMDHLKMQGGVYEEKERGRKVQRPLRDIYHYATKVYLQHLYRDWNGKDFAHKGLHPVLTAQYKRAEDEELRLLEEKIVIGDRVMRKQEEDKEKLLCELKKKENEKNVLKKTAGDHLKKIEELEAWRKKLDVQEKEQEKLSDGHIAKYEKMLRHHFEMMKRLVDDPKKNESKKKVTMTVMGASGSSGFSLQDFFDSLYPRKTEARMVLFGDETSNDNNRITKLILSEWNIVFDKQEKYDFKEKKDAKERKKGDTGVDEGGPSRQFLTEVFGQQGTLCVKIGDVSVELFENTPSGAVVKTDERLSDTISRAAEVWIEKNKEIVDDTKDQVTEKSIKRAKEYSRAIGRIMMHALAHKQTLPSTSMPPFIMHVMLHGYDDDYHRDDILKHISMMDIQGESILNWLLDDNKEERDENGDAWTTDTFFRSYIPNTFIHTRKILLGSLQDGLTFGGKPNPSNDLEKGCGISSIFAMVPMKAIQHVYFARPAISLEDLWAVLEPKFGVGVPDVNLGMDETAKEQQIEEQREFYHGNFKKYLKESDEEDKTFLVKLVEAATGSNYLPFDEKFKINIEFSFGLDPCGYPNFHACTFDVVIPGYSVHFDDFKTFKEKMNFVIGEVYNKFDMN